MAVLSTASPRASGAAGAPRRRPTTGSTRTLISSAQLNRRSGKIAYRIVLTVVIVAFTLAFIGPLYFLFSDGLKSTQEVIATPPTLYPHHVYPSTYVQAWDRLDMARLLWNTLYYAFGALAFQLVFDVTAAYALSKLRPFLGNAILFLMLATLMIPATVLVIPQYVTMAAEPIVHWNLIGSPWAIWLPSVANAFNIFLLKRFFDSIPTDYIDAAQIDGASRIRRSCGGSCCPYPGRSSVSCRSSGWSRCGRTSSGRSWLSTATPRPGRPSTSESGRHPTAPQRRT